MTLLRRSMYAAAIAAFGGACFFAPTATAYVAAATAPSPPLVVTIPESQTYIKHVPATEAAAVRIILPESLGSGVHIGDGFIVTAAHVVKGQTEVKIKSREGQESPAAVLWASSEYDVALLRTEARLPAADIDCRTARVGAQIRTVGNPLGMEFISSYGKIAGAPRQFKTTWKSAFVTDLTVIIGNSGGPVFAEADDRLVGIVVGVLGAPGGNDTRSYLGLSTVVPSSVVCTLMGRVK